MLLQDIINENVQSQVDIEKLAVRVITKMADISVAHFKEVGWDTMRKENGFYLRADHGSYYSFEEILTPRLSAAHFDSLKPHKGYSPEFTKFLDTMSINVVVRNRDDALGMWVIDRQNTTKGHIEIYYRDDHFEGLEEQVARYGPNPDLIRRFFSARLSTMIHEIQHAYDDFRSEGKYIDPEWRKYTVTEPDHDTYLKFSHEVSARYTQMITRIKERFYSLTYTKSASGVIDRPTVIRRMLNDFKNDFGGWFLLEPETQRRLLTRAGTEMALLLDQTKSAPDLTEPVEAFEARLAREHKVEIDLQYLKSSASIVINRLLGDDATLDEVMRKIVYFADTHRSVVLVTPARGFVGHRIGEMEALFRKYRFLKNHIRNKGKRDHRYNERWLRYPRR